MDYTVANAEGDMVPAVLISAEEYVNLSEDSALLDALYFVGLDAWDGYDEALALLEDDDDTEEEE